MVLTGESKIRREGFPITQDDAEHLLNFINLVDAKHEMIEPEIIVKLELLSNRYHIEETK